MRKPDSHKGENGVVLVVGGSEEFIGAPFLATRSVACLRTGPDLVILACPKKVAWAVNCHSPDLITMKLRGKYLKKSHKRKILKLVKKADVVLLGPGLGQNKSTKELLRTLVKEIKKPKVIDADALKAVKIQDLNNAVFTPHQKEFEILLKNSGLNKNNYRRRLKNNIILLKGKIDKIISKDRVKNNHTGNEAMTVGGTGDILSGLVAGYISQGKSLFDAAYRAAYVNGKIGDRLREKLGYGLIANDFLREIAKLNKKNR
ncbi:MAG: NAD(P)H-hydrate dehydratase [Nanoarchaeota archaeon]|nr:NAD(P)H-hydrate dehydratase [DPANN group archaeon]MBL7116438.1 NAD(P)H-hydrate dehydratase [Nanoarchaeota archaeon]